MGVVHLMEAMELMITQLVRLLCMLLGENEAVKVSCRGYCTAVYWNSAGGKRV